VSEASFETPCPGSLGPEQIEPVVFFSHIEDRSVILFFFLDAPVACSIANSKTSNALEKDLDLLASVPSPSSVSRKVSLLRVSG
jgi:hypothetical protein